ncbi:putative [Pyruvate dehydrogenase (acetyl-transferring)]-phosphatase [Helianthus annuus]|uniref:[Pyruvate dehydrogenase (Acetyl-transferring)]-phosphatase n=1 Tax=Helianthus annuus TaxID=4232 RepID=A0A9K3I213_HELAN|nr:putative [Pyruvate dehydrogenase (acetyl-transferring)]-phosphatase [Helianthus annuus]
MHEILPEDRFVIFASDGLWEHLSNQEAVDIVQNHPNNLNLVRQITIVEAAKWTVRRVG